MRRLQYAVMYVVQFQLSLLAETGTLSFNFVDDYSRRSTDYFLKTGDEVADKFKLFERHVANDSSQNIASLRSNNGGEYLSQKFESYLGSNGIHHELAVPYSAEKNGVAER